MPVKLEEIRTDHRGDALPPGIYALVAPNGAITGYKARWREEDDDGVRRNRAKLFSARKLGSLDRAREEALAYRQAAVEIVERGEVARPDRNGNMTVGDLFKEWITDHAAPNLSEGYATEVGALVGPGDRHSHDCPRAPGQTGRRSGATRASSRRGRTGFSRSRVKRLLRRSGLMRRRPPRPSPRSQTTARSRRTSGRRAECCRPTLPAGMPITSRSRPRTTMACSMRT
jgi:hypothetical protein